MASSASLSSSWESQTGPPNPRDPLPDPYHYQIVRHSPFSGPSHPPQPKSRCTLPPISPYSSLPTLDNRPHKPLTPLWAGGCPKCGLEGHQSDKSRPSKVPPLWKPPEASVARAESVQRRRVSDFEKLGRGRGRVARLKTG